MTLTPLATTGTHALTVPGTGARQSPADGVDRSTAVPRLECNDLVASDDLFNMKGLPETVKPTIEEVFAVQRVPLLRLAFLVSGSEPAAEDIAQTVFASVQGHWDAIRDPGPYLKRAVVNVANDGHRRGFRERTALESISRQPTAIPEVDHTWFTLQQLPALQRTVVVLHFYEDLSLVEVADLLDRPAATIRSDLRRALIRLRRTMP